MIGAWHYIYITWKDGTRWTFSPFVTPTRQDYDTIDTFILTKITDSSKHSVDLNWWQTDDISPDGPDSPEYSCGEYYPARLLTSITKETKPPTNLLSFYYDANEHLTDIIDIYHRKIHYTYTTAGDLKTVSQIVSEDTVIPPGTLFLWIYSADDRFYCPITE